MENLNENAKEIRNKSDRLNKIAQVIDVKPVG
jgi:hypothetical protein